MSKKKALYIDIDGTLARFHDADKMFIEMMWTQGFYISLKPFENLVEAVKLFKERNPEVEVFVLSAVLDTEPPFVVGEKNAWLDKYLPVIDKDHRIFTRAGEDKSSYIDMEAFDCSLLDDFNKNLYEFEDAGGHAIKFHNDVNHRGKGEFGGSKGNLWPGDLVHHYDSPKKICQDLEASVLGQVKDAVFSMDDFVIEDNVLVEYVGHSETVVIPRGVQEIGINAFWNNKDVQEVVFPDSLRVINNGAFSGVNLKSLNLPMGLKTIESQAFAGCNCLESANIPASVAFLHNQAFDCCERLKEIIVSDDNDKYRSENGIVYRRSWEANVLRCPTGRTGNVDITSNDFFGKILAGAFKNCTGITSVDLPRHLFSIEDGAFYGCSSLEHIEIPEVTRHIADFAFADCNNLKSIVLPEHLETLGAYVFSGSKNIAEVIVSDAALVDYCERLNLLDEVYMTPAYDKLRERYEGLVGIDNAKTGVVDELLSSAKERTESSQRETDTEKNLC